ncbi:MAG: Fe-S cluster assembly ATPase SufC [Candidatus Marsarchaeota archaeon]|nr:Fe-S cluster assembly ATPase SufC [Candidatus Marsarchaeota archaeon]
MKLEIKDLHVSIDEKEIVRGVSLTVNDGELHVIMGPNGSGKTTLAKAIMGHPQLKVTAGDILVDGKSILAMKVNERAKLGLFLQFQNPIEIEGLGLLNFLNTARSALTGKPLQFKEFMSEIRDTSKALGLKEDIVGRSLNHGFSGGEKKKAEVLQMRILKPKISILDEPDSGLDVDAVRIVAENVEALRSGMKMGLIVITHYSRILNYMQPQFIHIMKDGKMVKEGGKELVHEVESKGYNI